MAGVRARGDGGRRRQLRRRLLDREPRSDGRPHRRLVDGRAAADAAGRGVPEAARRGVHVRADRRRGDRRRERPVRLRAREPRARRHRDEPARLALVRARVEGHGLPDREARGPARGRLHAGRAAERHHGQVERGLRARARLRRGQGPAFRLREVPLDRAGARHRDAGRRRVARARPHVSGGLPEGARGTRGLGRASGDRRAAPVLRGRARVDPRGRATARRRRRRPLRQAVRPARREDRTRARDRRGRGAEPPASAGPAGRRLLRGGVRGADSLLLPVLRGLRWGRRASGPTRRDPRLGAEPDRPRDRVRLLLHARRAGVPRARLRGGAPQLEPRDGLDRLRHL